ncbi:hypothetical protein AAYO93_16470 [Diaminobutyricibacter sp. McL0608]
MTRNDFGEAHPHEGFFNKLNRVLFPWLGPPPLGPYDEPPAPSAPPPCPLCGKPMADHDIDRTGIKTQLYCP